MNFPAALNPLRRTQFAWLLPLTWAILQCAAKAMPTTIEVFLHHRFGSRSGKALLQGFILLLVVSVTLAQSDNRASIRLFPLFIFAYTIAAMAHWLTAQQRPATEQIHSYSTGEPWPFWRRAPAVTTTVQQYLEPALCCVIGFAILILDSSLAHWLFISAIALFIKEQVIRTQLRTRQLDAFDNRFETRRLAPRGRADNEAFVEARPAPARFQDAVRRGAWNAELRGR